MGKGAKGGVGFHTHPHHHFGGRRYRHWGGGGGGAARTEYHSIQNRSNYFYAHYEKRQKRALHYGRLGAPATRVGTHVGYARHRPLYAGRAAYTLLHRGFAGFPEARDVDERDEQQRWAVDGSGDDQHGTTLQYHLWRRAHRYVAPTYFAAPDQAQEPCDDDAWRAELPPDSPNFCVLPVELACKRKGDALMALEDCGIGAKLGAAGAVVVDDVAAAARACYDVKVTKTAWCCFDVEDEAAIEARDDAIEEATLAALCRANARLPADATTSFVRMGTFLAVVFEVVPPAAPAAAPARAAPPAFAPVALPAAPVAVAVLDAAAAEGVAEATIDDDDGAAWSDGVFGLTRTQSLRHRLRGANSFVAVDSEDYLPSAPPLPAAAAEGAVVAVIPSSLWTGPPPPLGVDEARAMHAIARAARGEFQPEFASVLFAAIAAVNAGLPGGAAPELRVLEDFVAVVPPGGSPLDRFVAVAPTGALVAAAVPPGASAGGGIVVHAPGDWGPVATSTIRPEDPLGIDAPAVALVLAGGALGPFVAAPAAKASPGVAGWAAYYGGRTEYAAGATSPAY